MKKKFLTILIAIIASIGTMSAESGTCGDNLTWDLTDGVLTISGTGNMTNWKSQFSVPWYSYCSSITSITIGNNVTNIGGYAFTNCSALKSVNIPNSVTRIGADAFFNCSGMTSITIPNSVTSIAMLAFSNCSTLTSVTIPNSVTSIGSSAFTNCSALTSIVVEDGNTTYDSRGNSNAIIETATNTLRFGCKNTAIPNSVTSIGDDAFYGCTGLTSIAIPNSVTGIGSGAFYGCSGMTSFTIGSSVTSIGSLAFCNCSGLTSITIPNSVTSIVETAFISCPGLTSIVVEDGNTTFDSRGNSNAIIETATNTLRVGCKNTAIPNNVTSIGDDAFYGCTGLTSITIPNSVTKIGSSAFYGCSGLTSITCEAITPPSCATNVFYNVDKTIPLYVLAGCVEAYTAAEGWKEFTNIHAIGGAEPISGSCGENVEWHLSALRDTLFISGMGEMTDYYEEESVPWHEYKEGIRWILMEEGLTSISWNAFSNCINLYSVDIPESVRKIGYKAFYNCSNLNDVYMPRYIWTIDSSVFEGCTSLPVVDNIRYAHWYLVEAVDKSLATYTIRDNTVVIGNKAFRNCTNLSSITLPHSVMAIGVGAFSGCANLTTFNHDNCFLHQVGGGAFYGCTSLEEMTLADSIHVIDYETFEDCTALHTVHLGPCVEGFEKATFYHCPALTKIEVAENSMYLSSVDGVVYSKDQKTFVLYPRGREDSVYHVLAGVTDLRNEAFSACYNIKAVVLPGTITHLGEVIFDQSPLLNSITCEAITPPTCEGHTFEGVDFSIPLYVPAESVEAYKKADGWKEFANIQPIQAKEVAVTEIEAQPTSNSVVIEWPKVAEATVYTIGIKKNGELVCTLTFNEQGQLQGITFAKPSRNGSRNSQVRTATQTASGWQYTIGGLESNTSYTYTVTAKASDNSVIYSTPGTFKTTGTPTTIDEVLDPDGKEISTVNCQLSTKIVRNGQLYILRNGILYNAQGARIE